MRRGRAIALAAASLSAAALALAGCQGKQADTGKAAAAAEVLPGSASDAMIAYDTLRSQPPLAVPSAPADGGRVRGSGASSGGDSDPDPLASEPAPVSTRAPDEAAVAATTAP